MTRPASDSWTLPWLGLGLSSNLSASDMPHPYRLLDAAPGLFDFVEYSAPISLEEARAQATLFPEMWRRRADVPVLFHPVHLNLWGPELEPASALAELDAHARAVGSPWVGNDVGWWHAGGQPFPGYLYVTPPFNEAGLRDCAAHALHIQAALSVPLVVENPAVLATRGDMHALDFMAKLHARTGLPLLLDLGHLLSHQLSAGLPLRAGLDGFPLEHVVEIHLAGGVVTRRGPRTFYVDDHTQPVREELFELLAEIIPRCARLRAVTFEGDGHPPEVALTSLRRLRALVPKESKESRPAIPYPVSREPVPTLTKESHPWALFDAGHGVTPATEDVDPEGTRADRDFRLAVVAEQLDREWPLTRLLLAATPEGLEAFTRSREYRALFDGLGRSLSHAFASWARKRVMTATSGQGQDGVAAALSLEMMLPHAFLQAPLAPAPGQVALAEDVRLGSFPADLTELVFATRALRRHLTGRAWACGAMEVSGLEALAQVAARPGPGPWRFAIRRKGPGFEVVTLPPTVADGLWGLADGPRPVEDLPVWLLEEGQARGLLRRA
ncbi:DUF692 family protein [Corallococcus sp. CA053C]|uniref:DUF692 domain-containing protein n=1 Tax=Corallococcus sp. CA053C TaxID=2316732 RepID=UPI000EA23725|nr:DUF692 family multinuclear iron-containing protein [Corallococcus sp. CA053C]RKG95240.1 DUF692 family protein [Corallococcus sp. CA053C]